MPEYYVADTETTGLEFGSEIIELAYLKVDERLGILETFEQRYMPSRPISPSASAAHQLTIEDLEGCPPPSTIPALLDVTLIAHNCPFDRRMLERLWDISDWLCTCRAAQQLYPEAPDHKLQTLKFYLGLHKDKSVREVLGAMDKGAHSALGDVLDLYLLLNRMIEDSGLALPEFIAECNKPVIHTVMPFGKHKGTPIKNLPRTYRQWLASDAFEDPWGDWAATLGEVA